MVQIGEGEQKAAFTGTVKRTLTAKKYDYDVDIQTDLFRLEQWKPYLSLLDWNWLSGEGTYPKIRFKVLAESMPYKAETIQKLKMEGDYANSLLSVENGEALLPGGAKVSFKIIGKPQKQEALLEWGIRAEMPNVQNVLKWLAGDIKGIDLPVLAQKGSFTGRIALNPKVLIVSANEFKIGETLFAGAIQKDLGDKVAYTAQLAAHNINLDAYTGWTPAQKPVALNELPTLIQGTLGQAKGLNGLDVRAM